MHSVNNIYSNVYICDYLRSTSVNNKTVYVMQSCTSLILAIYDVSTITQHSYLYNHPYKHILLYFPLNSNISCFICDVSRWNKVMYFISLLTLPITYKCIYLCVVCTISWLLIIIIQIVYVMLHICYWNSRMPYKILFSGILCSVCVKLWSGHVKPSYMFYKAAITCSILFQII